MSNAPGLIAELKRRKVVRVAVVYVATAFAVLQAADIMLPRMGVPDWGMNLIVALIVLGFPIALVLGWALELTPDGLKRTEAMPSETADPNMPALLGKRTVFASALLVVLGLGIGAGWFLRPVSDPGAASAEALAEESAAQLARERSIAVLPFADMSPDSDKAYFADGISEEILNVLVRIPGLQVAGRTSSFAYRGQDQDLREIGNALDVSHILEGSVRRSGTRLRITAQLIRSADGFHIWSETYDREIADIFDIQDDIAGAVADELATSLGLDTGAVSVARTSDLAAYESFLHARQLYRDRGQANLELAAAMLTETLARDPEYGPGWTLLAGVYGVMHAYRQGAPELRVRWNALSVETARRAITINPADAQAHAFLGSALAHNWNWIEGLEMLDRAVALAPNDPDVLDTAAQILRKVGYGAEALELSEHAVALDPQAAIYRNTFANVLASQGRFEESDAQFRAAIDIDPGLRFPYENLMWSLARAGDMAGTQSALTALLDRGHPAPGDEDLIERFMAARSLADVQSLAAESRWFIRILYSLLASDMEYHLSLPWFEAAFDRRRSSADYYPFWLTFRGEIFADARWKDRVRRGGLVDLWRARGFPPQCRPRGAEDFECD